MTIFKKSIPWLLLTFLFYNAILIHEHAEKLSLYFTHLI